MNRKAIAGLCSIGLASALLIAASPATAQSSDPSDGVPSGLPAVGVSQSAPEGTTVLTAADFADAPGYERGSQGPCPGAAFEDHGETLPDADADRGAGDAPAAAGELVRSVADDAAARGPERVPDR